MVGGGQRGPPGAWNARTPLPLSPSHGRHQDDLPVPAQQQLRVFQDVLGDDDSK